MNTDSGDHFGAAVGLSGGYLSVGAPREDAGAESSAENPLTSGANSSGAVYGYKL